MNEIKELLEELLAVQVLDLAMRMEARDARAQDALSESSMREALALVRSNQQRILRLLREAPAESEREDDRPGGAGNLAKAKKMSMKQKRYDLGSGLF